MTAGWAIVPELNAARSCGRWWSPVMDISSWNWG